MIRALPNIITASRIVGAAVLAFLKPFSVAFYVVYSFCGLSDVLDGYIARKYRLESKLGSVLDSIADIVFYTVMILRLLPMLSEVLPGWIWLAVSAILILRVVSYVIVAVKYHRFAALHTYLNKATGIAVFLVPYIVQTPAAEEFCIIVCLIAIFASAKELYTHISASEYAG